MGLIGVYKSVMEQYFCLVENGWDKKGSTVSERASKQSERGRNHSLLTHSP